MKLTHIALAGNVSDNLTYQDNLLPKYHKKLGLEISMITSKYIIDEEGEKGIDSRDIYYNDDGVKMIRLDSKYKTNRESKFKRYHNLFRTLQNEKPDILFIHGVQFIEIKDVIKFLKKHPNVKVYVDNHADYSNSATNWLSKNILHKIIWRKCAQMIEPYTTKFYGVLPARVKFLEDVYNIPKQKIELLLMGADDEKIDKFNSKSINSKNSKDI